MDSATAWIHDVMQLKAIKSKDDKFLQRFRVTALLPGDGAAVQLPLLTKWGLGEADDIIIRPCKNPTNILPDMNVKERTVLVDVLDITGTEESLKRTEEIAAYGGHMLEPKKDATPLTFILVHKKVRCAFSDRIFHSRMPLDPTHVRLKLFHACDQ